jgi:hypothetical protein
MTHTAPAISILRHRLACAWAAMPPRGTNIPNLSHRDRLNAIANLLDLAESDLFGATAATCRGDLGTVESLVASGMGVITLAERRMAAMGMLL